MYSSNMKPAFLFYLFIESDLYRFTYIFVFRIVSLNTYIVITEIKPTEIDLYLIFKYVYYIFISI